MASRWLIFEHHHHSSMSILHQLRARFEPALAAVAPNVRELLDMIRPAQDPRFGDYQANFAMSLGKLLGKPPREVAQQIVAQAKLDDLCEKVEVAGPGFINLTLKDSYLLMRLRAAQADERLGVAPVSQPRTYVVDYSSPNVAKPMHVGHIRSTVIGDALYRTLAFLGHKVISDNHLGDWGTQFGMIIYGFRYFGDRAAYAAAPLAELLRIYRQVSQLVTYHEGKAELPTLLEKVAAKEAALKEQQAIVANTADKKQQDKLRKQAEKQARSLEEDLAAIDELRTKLAKVEGDPKLAALAKEHANIGSAVLQETAKLHAGDLENLKLWQEFLPECRKDIQRIYDRLDIRFDYELGESFYHDQLAAVVEDFQKKGLARESEGAMCVFLEGEDAPMIIRKRDGAFLYSTTDLATIKYRMEQWQPDAMLYVVDHRQGEHFDKLFAAARLWGYRDVELKHVSFGTILGDDGKPYKTRSGDTVGLEGLLDEAVARALKVVTENDRDRTLSTEEARQIAEIVGIGALKYADLMQNRTSDYKFSYDKMLATTGNTATYMQYSYARVQSIFRKANLNIESLRTSGEIRLEDENVRAVALDILRFSEALDDVTADYLPSVLTNYLFELTQRFFKFYDTHSVLHAETEALRNSRALVCDLVARVIKQGLQLLGIKTVERM